ncbi:AMP-binding protein [Haploplasma axanthum]|uniref:Linear gramicidin synthase subunit A n=1 Tax=Haploplasma axanthum TaxID=29552 RepID=A0A449BF21_HAPAX|nr:AMP-binding protein [Haploplasma axanthum]VEU81049.1 Linear gramicidin synthase subunit A [Haploplasma axanthum]
MFSLNDSQTSFLNAIKIHNNYPSNIGGVFKIPENINDLDKKIFDYFNSIPILKTKLTCTNNSTYQYIDYESTIKVNKISSHEMNSFFEESFSLYNSLLFKVALSDNNIIIVSHHILLDGGSIKLLINNLYSYLEFNITPSFNDRPLTSLSSKNSYYDFWNKELSNNIYTPIRLKRLDSSISSAKRKMVTIDSSLSKKINLLTEQYAISKSCFFEAIISLYISYINDSNNIIIGTSTHNRNYKNKDSLGMFAKTLPLSISINKEFTFIDLLTSLKKKHYEILRNREISYEEILKIKNQLFDVIVIDHGKFTYENNFLFYPSLELSLVLNIVEKNNEIILYFDYKESIFNETEINRLIKRIKLLIKQSVVNPKIESINYLLDDEKFLIKQSNEIPSVLELYYQNLYQSIDSIAIIDNNIQYTFNDLELLSNKLANKLLLIKDDIVAIDIKKSFYSIAAMLAIIKAGKTFVFKTSYNQDFLQDYFHLNHEFFNSLNFKSEKLFIKENQFLCRYYTSGTTNRKEVFIKNISVANHINNHDSYQQQSKDTNVIPSVAMLHFDISLEEIMLALLNKKTLLLFDENSLSNPKYINNQFLQYNVDFFTTTPSVFNYLWQNGAIESLKNLKIIVLGGEVLTKSIAKVILENTNSKLYNSYGPTETTIAVTSIEITDYKKIPIGKAHDNINIIITNNKSTLPKYEIGEILISGISVARINEDRFVIIKNVIYYKTGDYGYQDEHNHFYYIGRIDSEIKRNGVRINLSYIDRVLEKNDYIEKSVSTFNNNLITTFYNTKSKVNKSVLYEHLISSLPKEIIPNNLVEVSKFDITAEGKIKFNSKTIEHNLIPYKPKSLLRKKVLTIFMNNLETDNISINDYYLTKGGDSIKALLLIATLEEFNLKINVDDLFQKTIANIIDEIKVVKHKKIYIQNNDFLVKEIVFTSNKKILLYGSSGFLGIHILNELIETTNLKIVIPLRISYLDFLNRYYDFFGTSLDESRIEYLSFNTFIDYSKICFVINATGNVKYIDTYENLTGINVRFLNSLVSNSIKNEVPLVHISTLGLSNSYKLLKENTNKLHIEYNNPYLNSKASAEKRIFDQNNPYLRIIRVGNLMPNFDTNKFQLNPHDNAFLRLLSTLSKESIQTNYTFDITPVDVAAKAILKTLLFNNKVSHILNPYPFKFNDLIDSKEKRIVSLGNDVIYSIKKIDSLETTSCLKKVNFTYPILDKKYLENLLKLANKIFNE